MELRRCQILSRPSSTPSSRHRSDSPSVRQSPSSFQSRGPAGGNASEGNPSNEPHANGHIGGDGDGVRHGEGGIRSVPLEGKREDGRENARLHASRRELRQDWSGALDEGDVGGVPRGVPLTSRDDRDEVRHRRKREVRGPQVDSSRIREPRGGPHEGEARWRRPLEKFTNERKNK